MQHCQPIRSLKTRITKTPRMRNKSPVSIFTDKQDFNKRTRAFEKDEPLFSEKLNKFRTKSTQYKLFKDC